MAWLGGTAVIFVVVLGLKYMNKSQDNVDVKKEMIEVVHRFPNYSQYGSYYDGLVDRCHAQAFESAYSLGGKRQAPQLNVQKYLSDISRRMASIAQSDGKSEVAAMLTDFNQSVNAK
jgi:hypothetical protein